MCERQRERGTETKRDRERLLGDGCLKLSIGHTEKKAA